MKKNIGLLFLLALFCVSAFAQETKNIAKQTNEWVRLRFENDNFSFEMPSNFTYFYDKNGFGYIGGSGTNRQTYNYGEMKVFNASMGKTVVSVQIYKVDSPKKHLRELVDQQKSRNSDISETSEFMEGFTVKQLEQHKIENFRNKKDVEISFITRFVASKNYVYILTAANRGAKTDVFERFFSAVDSSANRKDSAENVKVVNISSLTPITLEQIGEVIEPDKEVKPALVPNQPIQIEENPLVVLTKPKAVYTDAARTSGIKGAIRLRLTFSANGGISRIGVISSLPKGLLRNAVFASLRIKFIPQEKDNEFVSTTKIVEHNFDIY